MSLQHEADKILRSLGVRPLKRLGQNFMVDDTALRAIVDALDLSADEPTVEIGAGLGFLTRHLLSKTRNLLLVELDRAYARYLGATYANDTVKVLEQDILKVRLDKHQKVVGNIPYNITSPIIEWLIAQRPFIRTAVLTVQWEVAQRLIAKPGSKIWGPLSIFTQFYSNPELVRKISKDKFYPSPKFDSSVVRFVFLDETPLEGDLEKKFFVLVRKSFQKRRKTILNSLTGDILKGDVRGIFDKSGIDSSRRPETLSIEEWVRLCESWPS